QNQRVGLIEVDAGEFRVSCFENSPIQTSTEEAPRTEDSLDARLMHESLTELSWDVQRWLLLLPNVRSPEARGLLRQVDLWVLLTACDHDAIVSSYRTLKALADLQQHSESTAKSSPRPRLSVALIDASNSTPAAKVVRKLAGVCQQ